MDAQDRRLEALGDRLAVRAGQQPAQRLVQPPDDHQVVRLFLSGPQNGRLRVARQRTRRDRHTFRHAQPLGGLVQQRAALFAPSSHQSHGSHDFLDDLSAELQDQIA